MIGILYICGTPIGNLEDITLRQLKTLKEVDLIAAEDTRHTLRLLNYYSIKCPLISYHKYNKKNKGKEIVKKLLQGYNIALVTDAGMPCISDPGEDIIKLCYKNNIKVTTVPGPTALISALILSGISTDKYIFEGFFPKNKKEQQDVINMIIKETKTVILYEGPHNILKTLELLNKNLDKQRIISVVREITKKYEEVITKSIDQLISYFKLNKPKGEFVIIISGADKNSIKLKEKEKWENVNIENHVNMYISRGILKKEAIKLVSKDRKVSKREIYSKIMKK